MFNQLHKYPEYDLSDYEGRTELYQFLYNQAVEEGAWEYDTGLQLQYERSPQGYREAPQDWDCPGVKITLANQD